ncbi:GPI-anchored protein LLG2-like [Zingiber officinale]|uniref:GPI-anchored protein LLG2-like n=1 Tax=Zingiber officinale TaxID=94328 RepID=UPI001C4B7BA4|nr:GPI-anchored protein LLG2-like [Zingiber officinale]
MGFIRKVSLPAVLLVVVARISVAASAFISDNALESRGSAGRSLLQAQSSCPIDFENLNYTVITSQCKGPKYPAKLCCAAFKEFACPYADRLNDGTNDCATTMFSYINLYGKYPPGLFASECREGDEGLACDALPPASDNADAQSLFSLLQQDTSMVNMKNRIYQMLLPRVSFVEVESLRNHAIFLGNIQSICLLVENTGCKENCIYFNQPGDEIAWPVFDLGSKSITDGPVLSSKAVFRSLF